MSYDKWAARHPQKEKPFPLKVAFNKLSYPLRIRLFDDSVFKRSGVALLLDSEVGKVFKSFDDDFPGLQLYFSDMFPEESILSRHGALLKEEALTAEARLAEANDTIEELQVKLSEAEQKLLQQVSEEQHRRPPQRAAAARASTSGMFLKMPMNINFMSMYHMCQSKRFEETSENRQRGRRGKRE